MSELNSKKKKKEDVLKRFNEIDDTISKNDVYFLCKIEYSYHPLHGIGCSP